MIVTIPGEGFDLFYVVSISQRGNRKMAVCENITGDMSSGGMDTTENVNYLRVVPWTKALTIITAKRDDLDEDVRYLSGILSLMKKNKY